MATRALTPVARRQSRVISSASAPGLERDWRKVLLSQDSEAIWQKLEDLVRGATPRPVTGYEHRTQELFLHLLATDRVSFYIEQNYSDEQIREDLLLLLWE